MSGKTMNINGFRAKILSEERGAWLSLGDFISEKITPPAGRISKTWLREAIAKAERFDVKAIFVTHSRYVSYNLRTVMTQRSGSYSVITKYQRNSNGDWYPTRKVENNIY